MSHIHWRSIIEVACRCYRPAFGSYPYTQPHILIIYRYKYGSYVHSIFHIVVAVALNFYQLAGYVAATCQYVNDHNDHNDGYWTFFIFVVISVVMKLLSHVYRVGKTKRTKFDIFLIWKFNTFIKKQKSSKLMSN